MGASSRIHSIAKLRNWPKVRHLHSEALGRSFAISQLDCRWIQKRSWKFVEICYNITQVENYEALDMTPGLGPRQQRFVDEYMVDLNATRAAIAAGFSKKAASQAGWDQLRKPKVVAEIGRRQSLLSERLSVSADNVISELAKLAFANVGHFFQVGDNGHVEVDASALTDTSKTAALAQVDITEKANGDQSIKIKLADKRAALTDLGKHLGLFSDKSAIAVTVEKVKPRSDRQLALHMLALIGKAAHEADQEFLELETM